jgi:hypothetical protein
VPDYVNRASFFEGQVIGAADLNLVVSYDRSAMGRHLRLQHSEGIVVGLELDGADRTTALGQQYKEVTCASGMAVDGTGLTIVVTEQTRVPEELFDELNVAIADPLAWYPVLLRGRDVQMQEATGPADDCSTTQPNRIAELFEVTFGRTDDVGDVALPPDVTIGPGATPRRILLGFVQWDAAIRRFKDVTAAANGVKRQYAGVHAGEVMGLGGGLFLRSGECTQSGLPAVRIQSGKKGTLEFGPQGAAGNLTPVMTVDTDGNLTVTGKIAGALAGGVQVESGVATDGTLLPLPAGITQQQIDDGEVVVQAQVAPRFQIPAHLAPAEKWFPHFYECREDARRVRCRVRWIRMTGPTATEDHPWVCDYVVMAFPRKGGA